MAEETEDDIVIMTKKDLAKAFSNLVAETGNVIIMNGLAGAKLVRGNHLESLFNTMVKYTDGDNLKYLIDNYNKKVDTNEVV